MLVKRIAIAACAALGVVAACSSSNNGPAGGPVVGAVDTHCTLPDGGMIVQTTSQASCPVPAGADAGVADYGATMYNSSGYDDDCKYHVQWSSTAIYENTNVTFTVSSVNTADGGPTIGANVIPEIYLNSTHPAPNTNYTTTENPPGTYAIGPVQFDEAGQWTVRFHLFENCDDGPGDSPHGHAAFFVNVP